VLYSSPAVLPYNLLPVLFLKHVLSQSLTFFVLFQQATKIIDTFWGLPSLLTNGYRVLFPGDKAAEA
jgi:hypothetical protein